MDESTEDKIRVLVVEPMREPYVKEIGGLEDMWAIVGGHIKATRPFPEDNAAVVRNESVAIMGLPVNRIIMDESGLFHKEIIQGTFFVAGVDEDDFISLSDEQVQYYTDYYKERTVMNAVRTTAETPAKEPPRAEKAAASDGTDKTKRRIRFIDSNCNTLFRIPDGGNLIITDSNGQEQTYHCQYIDSSHVSIGTGYVYHICEFAGVMKNRGNVYRPEKPQEGDILDTYEIFQLDLSDRKASAYAFCPYEMSKGKIRPAHYRRMYAGVLSPKTTLEDIFRRHNSDSRPFSLQMRSLSVSDIVVLNRAGKRQAFYVDSFGFEECGEFLNPPRRTRDAKKKTAPER